MSRHVATAAVRIVAPAGLAALAFLTLALSPPPRPVPALIGLGLAAAALAAAAAPAGGRPRLGVEVPARVLLAAGALAYAARQGIGVVPLAVAGGLLLGLLLAEPLLHRLARPWYEVANLPVAPGAAGTVVVGGLGWWINSAAILLTGLVAAAAGPGWLLPVPVVGAALVSGWLLVDGAWRWRTGHRAELAALTEPLARLAPRFLLYFSAPPGSEYQVRMWLPHLRQLGEPFLVVLPERDNAAPLAATGVPVVVYETFQAFDAVMVPSLRAAFYVNNGMKNAHCVRYTHLRHVQLYHGDSDKAVTASPLNQLFDQIFVAGQAAIDRFAAYGVEIPPHRFRIVGRPQVAGLALADRPIREVTAPVVLYAPTWVGAHTDSNYCSLPIAERIVAALLARGATVIMRPHPYSERDRASAAALRRVETMLATDQAATGRDHLWGPAACERLSLFACMDRSDAMVCDVSSVASEYLYTGKPFAITDMTGAGERFVETFPVARAAYVLPGDSGAAQLNDLLTELLERDRLAARRAELRTYYLGEIPSERYAERFLTAARQCLDTAPEQARSRV